MSPQYARNQSDQPSGRRPVLFSYLMLTLIPAIVCAVLLYLIRVS